MPRSYGISFSLNFPTEICKNLLLKFSLAMNYHSVSGIQKLSLANTNAVVPVLKHFYAAHHPVTVITK